MAYFIISNDRQEGPYDEAQLREALAAGSISIDTMAWLEGDSEWRTIGAIFPDTAPPLPGTVREVKASRIPFPTIFLDAIKFPCCRQGWMMVLVGALFFTVAGIFTGFIGGIFISGYLFAFYFQIISSSASGSDECPDWPGFSSFMDDIFVPYTQGIVALLISVLPAIVLFVIAAREDSAPLFVAAGVGVVWALYYHPMAIIGIVIFGNIGGALPQRVIPALYRTFPSSLLLGVVKLLLLLVYIFKPPFGHSSIIGHLYQYVVYIYLLMVDARFQGLFYARERDAIGWG